MNITALLCGLFIVLDVLVADAYAATPNKPGKPAKNKKPKKPRASITSVRFGTAFLTGVEEARKIAKDLDKNEVEVVGLLGVPATKLEAYQSELKAREYVVHKTKDGSILAARGGKTEVSEPGIIFTGPNGRRVYVAIRLGGNIPAVEASMMGQAAKRVRGQDADWVLFKKGDATDKVSISIAEHLTTTANKQGHILIAKGKVECELIDLELPGPGTKLSQHAPQTGLNVPSWVWILIIFLAPAIVGFVAIYIIQAKAARRARETPRTL